MKKIFTLLLMVFMTTGLWAQSEFFNTIEFHNKTKSEIIYLFCSPGDSDYWGPDVLGDSRTMESGEVVEFFISYPNESDYFDFMAIDDEGNVYEIYDQEITDGTAAYVVINKSSQSDDVDLYSLSEDFISLEIVNSTGYEIYFLFVSPSDSEMYGIDFMDSETTLPDGDSITVLLFDSDAEIEYDVQGVDADDDSYSFSLSIDPELGDQYVEITIDDLD